MCGCQRPLVCSLDTRNLKTNRFDSKGILADLTNNVKMSLSRAWCGLADWNSGIQLQYNVSTCSDDYHHCYCNLLEDVRKITSLMFSIVLNCFKNSTLTASRPHLRLSWLESFNFQQILLLTNVCNSTVLL